MKEKTFTEHDSLELIAQMIQQSKSNMKVGSGNILLYYGYPALILSVIIYLLVRMTDNHIWSALWFLMFVPSIWLSFKRRKNKIGVITHIDKAISSTWSILGQLFLLTTIAIAIFGSFSGSINFVLMLPLSMLYAGIGIAITGVIVDFKLMIYSPLAAFAVAIYMLDAMITGAATADWWNLLFGASFLVMMIIPGHFLNNKIKKGC